MYGLCSPSGDYSLGAYTSGLRDLLVGALGVEGAALVGQSRGGGGAMQLAYQHPELCERLMLVASGGLAWTPPAPPRRTPRETKSTDGPAASSAEPKETIGTRRLATGG